MTKDGVLRPDLDHRLVTGRLMALYLGIGVVTLWRWTTKGKFTSDQVQSAGDRRPHYYYRPSRICRPPLETVDVSAEKHQPEPEE